MESSIKGAESLDERDRKRDNRDVPETRSIIAFPLRIRISNWETIRERDHPVSRIRSAYYLPNHQHVYTHLFHPSFELEYVRSLLKEIIGTSRSCKRENSFYRFEFAA